MNDPMVHLDTDGILKTGCHTYNKMAGHNWYQVDQATDYFAYNDTLKGYVKQKDKEMAKHTRATIKRINKHGECYEGKLSVRASRITGVIQNHMGVGGKKGAMYKKHGCTVSVTGIGDVSVENEYEDIIKQMNGTTPENRTQL